MSVLLVEDAIPVRQRLSALISETPTLRVVAEAGTIAEATDFFDSMHPQSVVLDLALPDGNGIDLLRHIRTIGEKCLVLILSNNAEPETRRCCQKLGADYVFGKAAEFERAIATLQDMSWRAKYAHARRREEIVVHRATRVVTSPIGLRAGPAATLVGLAQKFDADIEVSLRGRKANAKSILDLLTLSAEHGAEVTVSAEGQDAEAAIRAVTKLFDGNFEQALAARPSNGTIERKHPQGKGEVALVADDDDNVRIMIKRMLDGNGYRTVMARTGLEAIELFKAGRHDIKVAVLDSTMPEMTGEEAMRTIRRMNPGLPVVMMSGSKDAPPLAENGTTAFLRKPFGMELLPLLHAMLNRSANGNGIRRQPANHSNR